VKSGVLYCKTIALRGVPELIRDLGGNPEHLFAQAGLDIAHINRGNYSDWEKICHLFSLMELSLDEQNLGMRFADIVPTDFLNSGPMLLLAALVPTMRDFLNLSIKYQSLHVNSFAYHYFENTEANEVEIEVQLHPLSPPCHQFTEYIMAIFIFILRKNFSGAKYNRISFQHRAPADLSLHEKIFQCPIEFNADKNMAYLPLDILDAKVSGRLQKLQPIVKAYLDRKITKFPLFETSIAYTVERLLPTIFGIRKSSMIDVAEILDINPKKLQRLLKDEGTTYSDVLENVRKSMAKRLLYESDISISHLAVLLDYSSNEAFNTACKRWVGLSPRQYRNQLRIPEARLKILSI